MNTQTQAVNVMEFLLQEFPDRLSDDGSGCMGISLRNPDLPVRVGEVQFKISPDLDTSEVHRATIRFLENRGWIRYYKELEPDYYYFEKGGHRLMMFTTRDAYTDRLLYSLAEL